MSSSFVGPSHSISPFSISPPPSLWQKAVYNIQRVAAYCIERCVQWNAERKQVLRSFDEVGGWRLRHVTAFHAFDFKTLKQAQAAQLFPVEDQKTTERFQRLSKEQVHTIIAIIPVALLLFLSPTQFENLSKEGLQRLFDYQPALGQQFIDTKIENQSITKEFLEKIKPFCTREQLGKLGLLPPEEADSPPLEDGRVVSGGELATPLRGELLRVDGAEKVFYPRSDPTACKGEAAALKLGHALLPDLIPDGGTMRWQGKEGVLRDRVEENPNDPSWLSSSATGSDPLTAEQNNQLLCHILFDFLIGNHTVHDSYGYAKGRNGTIVSTSKGESFSGFEGKRVRGKEALEGAEKLAAPGEAKFYQLDKDPDLYFTQKFIQSVEAKPFSFNWGEPPLIDFLQRCGALTPQEVKRYLGEYAAVAFPQKEEEFYQDIVDRAKDLSGQVKKWQERMEQALAVEQPKGGFSAPPPQDTHVGHILKQLFPSLAAPEDAEGGWEAYRNAIIQNRDFDRLWKHKELLAGQPLALQNNKNDCHLNTVFQVALHNPQFRHAVMGEKLDPTVFCAMFVYLACHDYINREGKDFTLDIGSALASVASVSAGIGQQEDAIATFMKLFPHAPVADVETTIPCHVLNNPSEHYAYKEVAKEAVLRLRSDQKGSLQEYIDHSVFHPQGRHFEYKTIQDNLRIVPDANKESKVHIASAPKALAMGIERIDMKKFRRTQFEMDIPLESFALSTRAGSFEKTFNYQITGLIAHVTDGAQSATSGHYRAFVRTANPKSGKEEWWRCDDMLPIEQVSAATVTEQCSRDSTFLLARYLSSSLVEG